MTDFGAATAWTRLRTFGVASGVVAVCIGMAGCETAGNILGGNNEISTETVAQPPAAPAKPVMAARFALAPIIGAPDAVAQQLRDQITQAGERNRIGILADRDPSADYGMRGYLVAARDRGGVKVSYIWDVTDPSGKRVNRITGEEVAAAAPGAKEPWASVTPTILQSVAEKVAGQLGTWAPTQPRAATPIASAAPAAPAVQTASVAVSPTATASVSPGVAGTLPIVSGAPGDGNSALAQALSREMQRQGVPLDGQAGRGYRVEGQVIVGAVKDGKQSIQIDWRVKDAKGASVGTVTQKNSIPPGSLDGSWGQTADAAAAAAAQGIIKLLPQQSAARTTN